jgi:hypothetical protein
METCVGCGAQVEPGQADLTADGVRCRACSLRAEVHGHVRAVEAAAEARRAAVVRRRAGNVIYGHWIVWITTVIIFCSVNGARHQAWFAPLALGVLVPLVGFFFQQEWARRTLLAMDGTTAIVLAGCGLFSDWEGRFLLLFLAAIPALLAVGLMLELRSQRTVHRSA